MNYLIELMQNLAAEYGATRLLAYGTAFLLTTASVVVAFLLYITRNEDQK